VRAGRRAAAPTPRTNVRAGARNQERAHQKPVRKPGGIPAARPAESLTDRPAVPRVEGWRVEAGDKIDIRAHEEKQAQMEPLTNDNM
jgi:hypothetical protein